MHAGARQLMCIIPAGKGRKQCECPQRTMDERARCGRTVEQSSAIGRSEVLSQAAVQMDPEDMMPRDVARHKRTDVA